MKNSFWSWWIEGVLAGFALLCYLWAVFADESVTGVVHLRQTSGNIVIQDRMLRVGSPIVSMEWTTNVTGTGFVYSASFVTNYVK